MEGGGWGMGWPGGGSGLSGSSMTSSVKKIKINVVSIYIFSLIGNIIAAVILSLTGILPAVISNTNPSQLGIYPNYILVYVHHLVIPECVISLSIFFFYFNNEHLNKLFKKQFKM